MSVFSFFTCEFERRFLFVRRVDDIVLGVVEIVFWVFRVSLEVVFGTWLDGILVRIVVCFSIK